MSQTHCIYWALYFYCYYIVIYNEISVQCMMMRSHGEAWACFLETKQCRLGVMGEGGAWNVLLVSSLLHNLVWVALDSENTVSQKAHVGNGSRLLSTFVAVSGYSSLTLIQHVWRCGFGSDILLRAPSLAISSSQSSSATDKINSCGFLMNESQVYSFPVQESFMVGK